MILFSIREVTTSDTFHFIFKTAGKNAASAPKIPATTKATNGCKPTGRDNPQATSSAPKVPKKKAPSVIMEKSPAPKIISTAKAVNTRGQAASTIFPILLAEVKGPTKKLKKALNGSELVANTTITTKPQATKIVTKSFVRSTIIFIFLLLSMNSLPNVRFLLFFNSQHIGAQILF